MHGALAGAAGVRALEARVDVSGVGHDGVAVHDLAGRHVVGAELDGGGGAHEGGDGEGAHD